MRPSTYALYLLCGGTILTLATQASYRVFVKDQNLEQGKDLLSNLGVNISDIKLEREGSINLWITAQLTDQQKKKAELDAKILGIVASDHAIKPIIPDSGLQLVKRPVADVEAWTNDLLPRTALKNSSWLDSNSDQPHLREINKDPMSEGMPATYHYKAGHHRARVFVIDQGIKIDHPVFRQLKTGGRIKYLNSTGAENYLASDDTHGTCMASLIAGKGLGSYPAVGSLTVANVWRDFSFNQAFAGIEDELNNSPNDAPVIISISLGYMPPEPVDGFPSLNLMYEQMTRMAERHRVMFVCAAGNDGDPAKQVDTDRIVPSVWGTFVHKRQTMFRHPVSDTRSIPQILIVGAFEEVPGYDRKSDAQEYGDRAKYSTPVEPAIYAPGLQKCAIWSSNLGHQYHHPHGTSGATAITAGVIADLWDSPEHASKNTTEMMEHVRSTAWPRGDWPDIRVIWNGYDAQYA